MAVAPINQKSYKRMKEQIQKKLNDSKALRWSVLALVAFTMLCGYFLTDVMSPLKPMLEKELLWDSLDYSPEMLEWAKFRGESRILVGRK